MPVNINNECLKCRTRTGNMNHEKYVCGEDVSCSDLKHDIEFERQERAAIMEFEAGLKRVDAERKAGLKG